MRFIGSETVERIGFDFYCDIANNIVNARKSKGLTQKELAKKSGIKLSRLADIELVKIRIKLEDVEALSKALDRTVDWLIDAELDSQLSDCLYLVWTESCTDFKFYQEAMSKRMAFMKFDKRFRESGVRYNSCRERIFVELVGVPVTDKEIQNRFPTANGDEDFPIERDEETSHE